MSVSWREATERGDEEEEEEEEESPPSSAAQPSAPSRSLPVDSERRQHNGAGPAQHRERRRVCPTTGYRL